MKVRDLQRKSSRRYDTRYSYLLGIQTYGDDNLYPQTLRNIIQASSTGSECTERFADFIEGNGFRDVSFASYTVNRRGDTSDDIHTLVCKDMAMYNGFALHVNYNIMGRIVEIQHIPFENCRLLEEDSAGYVSKIAVHPDWTGRKTRNGEKIRVDEANIDYIDVFNPKKDVVLSQIEKAGGIEYYKGQVLWVSLDGNYIYPTGKGDSVATEMSTDEGLSNVKYRNVRNNFLPAGMIITKRGSNPPSDDEEEDSGFSDSLIKLQGDTNASKLLDVEIEADEEKPEFVPITVQNYDKEFTATDSSVVERIYSAYGQEPWYCIRVGKLGFSGDILEDAFEYYNSVVSKQQRAIERAFRRVFRYWYEIANVSSDYSVEPLKYVRNAATNNNQ